MRRAILSLLLAAFVPLAACGGDEPSEVDGEVARLTDQIKQLQTRIVVLETEDAEAEDRFDDWARRMRSDFARMKVLVARIKQGSDEAGSSAAAASDEVAEAVRDLAVLTKRYDYHLRRYHGGG